MSQLKSRSPTFIGLLSLLLFMFGCASDSSVSQRPSELDPDETSLAGDWRPRQEEARYDSAQPAAAVAPAERTEQVRPAPAKPAPVAQSNDGWLRGSLAFPTGDANTSSILLEKLVPAEAITGKPFSYDLKVTNISRLQLDDVEVSEAIPASFKLGEVSSDAKVSNGGVKWNVGNLAPGESKSLRLSGTPTGAGQVGTCSSVTYNTALCLATTVVAPSLKLTKTGPAEVMVCDEIPYKFTVVNNGSGMARNVKIEDIFPEGMTTTDGRRSAVLEVGNLGAGESKDLSLKAKVTKTGQYTNQAMARADNVASSGSSPVNTIVRQPVLAITKTGPEKQFIGRPITYDITVTNKGDGVARETVLVDALPADSKFESASDGGRFAAGKVQWALGELAPNASKKVSFTISSPGANVIRTQASAQARCAEAVTAQAQTTLAGIPALLLECVDVTDPNEVGQDETYIITVTNQGSAPDTNIKIVAMLEDPMQFVSAGGATRGSAAGKTITFDPLPSLAPKAKAEWRVVVKAVNPGDVRFKVDMTADQLTRPVQETESSNFYK